MNDLEEIYAALQIIFARLDSARVRPRLLSPFR